MNIRDVEHAVLAHPANMLRIDTDLNGVRGHGTEVSHRNQSVVLIESQHHVIDRDHRLGRKDLEESDLFICERTNLHTANENSPNGDTLAQQWNGESRPSTPLFRRLQEIRVHFGRFQDVMNMHRLPVENSPAGRPTTVDRVSLANLI